MKYIFFSFIVKDPVAVTHYFCSEEADTVLVTLVTLFIYFFFTIHVHSFHKGRIVVVEVYCSIFVVMYEYYLITGLILLDLLSSVICAVLKVIHILI